VWVDGVVESPDTWTDPYFSPEVGQLVGSLIAAGDAWLTAVAADLYRRTRTEEGTP
jgi:hypothetical protein